MPVSETLRRRRTWLIAVPVVLVLAAVVGPFVYINFIREDAPDRLSFEDAPPEGGEGGPASSTTAADGAAGPAALAGTWTVGEGSTAGYRVDEVLFGQDTEAVGRTSDVTGDVTIDGTTVTGAAFAVDLTTVRSDEERRDGQFRGRIMDVEQFPQATFELTEPIELAELPEPGTETTVTATGDFTIRGVTRSVTTELTARRDDGTVRVLGTIPVEFDDYGIPDASFGPAQVEDEGEIEFILVLRRA